ncbi:MAG: DNA (cytosine-5-)-methyltransferase [Bacteroidetes bacterium]|nr:MAG: DNA (cytosine-5-)-methyltransferase [Bacteroidota bacterium]
MRVVSLFSGAGGLDLGFIWAGHEVVFANDVYHDAVETYRLNIGDHIYEGDIAGVASDEIPDCDIVIGGFPCQGFSVANTQRKRLDARNQLYLEMVRVIRDKRPRYFLAENVKGILSLEKGEVFREILRDFADIGYDTQFQVLNAANYGVPQRRERVFIVGVRRDISWRPVFPLPTHDRHARLGQLPWVAVGDALAGLPDPDAPNDLHNHLYSKYKLRFNGYIGHRAIDPTLPAPTVTARGDDKGGVVVLHHPSNTRRMTCRELATVQGFPLDYEFVGGISSVYRQIGNAVPPPLGRVVGGMFGEEVKGNEVEE